MVLSQMIVGWLLVVASALTVLLGAVSRSVIGRRRGTRPVRAVVHLFRRTGVAWVLFGRFRDDVLDDDELDTMILMPTIVVAGGLALTAAFLIGIQGLA
ncbi:Uncharacterised protein [Mycolicibacterium phlei]|uniref:Uncharacterized protein n=1 Tax=Mycolicibacterium phlei DSM 43239 = CCUG 21000 TaxID=1226750 RepID=A0A5N5VCN8_MYCPH|nr:hypothetical protein [Mycolicibacterium phlei]EID14547.1 hypothetical protein MPHLEI_10920 [Mycolicibacterium phlei RIVM601174]KAB7759711.1 hypothetical protein MPHL21000_01405 [Mycolicibacterium phlei DSM 43239 = CCUG 21000]KXW69220.1 hypothetical protein MPHL43072_21845 [Mycolicibacterium phlei DSM 43072]KXW74394.1 hypothetical protein MPHL43070_00105 [Mycolicibacterium phlei DSM 43070]VEG11532.1 Uncharacterised protein [Mycobacteroides chelonae]